MADANHSHEHSERERSANSESSGWQSRLASAAQYLHRRDVVGIRLTYSTSADFADFDFEIFSSGETQKCLVPHTLCDDFIAVFFEMMETRYPSWRERKGVHGVFDWHLARNTVIHEHVEPMDDGRPILRYGF
jgi:hypothetical protein